MMTTMTEDEEDSNRNTTNITNKSNYDSTTATNDATTTTTSLTRKRARREEDGDDDQLTPTVQHPKETPTSSPSPLPPPPAYGTKEYWEDRYKYHRKIGDGEDDAPDPFHAWYFTFDELAPLLLPLIFGQNSDDDDEEDDNEDPGDDDEDGEDKDDKARNTKNVKPDYEETTNQTENRNDDDVDEIEEEDQYDSAEEEEAEIEVEAGPDSDGGLTKNGPISVLEIGCGDVPLGRDLALAIEQMHSSTESMTKDGEDKNNSVEPTEIVEKVICIDYSENVIDAMRKELKELRDDAKARLLKTISISYEVADARKLPYKGESFDLLLEKGTLDAMLSGGDGSGSENCRQIVSECGRVLKKGGLLLLVSHINAHTDTGLQWLDEVIVPGLRNGAGKFAWVVEVHGNEPDTLSDGEQANPDDDDTQQDSPGPCVYIIKKGRAELKDDEYDPKNPPTIPLRFFNY